MDTCGFLISISNNHISTPGILGAAPERRITWDKSTENREEREKARKRKIMQVVKSRDYKDMTFTYNKLSYTPPEDKSIQFSPKTRLTEASAGHPCPQIAQIHHRLVTSEAPSQPTPNPFPCTLMTISSLTLFGRT